MSLAFVVCSGAGIAACTENNSRRGTIINFATYESWDEGFSYLSIMDGFGRVTKSDETGARRQVFRQSAAARLAHRFRNKALFLLSDEDRGGRRL